MSSGSIVGLGDHPGLAVLEQPVVVREDVDRDRVDARVRHLRRAPAAVPRRSCFDRRLVAMRSRRNAGPRRTRRAASAPGRGRRHEARAARPAASPARGRRSLLEVVADGPRRSPSTCWPPRRYAGRRPSRRTSRSAPSPAPARCSTRCARSGQRVILPVLLPDIDLDWAVYDGAGRAGAGAGAACSSPPAPRLGVDAVATADVVLAPGLAVDRTGDAARPGRRLLRPGARPGPGRHLRLRAALRRRGLLDARARRRPHDRPGRPPCADAVRRSAGSGAGP